MTPAMTAMEVMDSSRTPRCCVACSLAQSFSMKPWAYWIISELSSSSPKETKADMAMAATRSTPSSIFCKSTGMTVWCFDSWKCGDWSFASCPRACRAVKRTRGWGWSTCCSRRFAMASTWALSSTYSTVCLMAASAACFACHASSLAYRAMMLKSELPRPSICTASTTRSMASSPVWKSSSASSSPSSSSMRAAQASSSPSSSSTSSMRSMQHSMARGAKAGRLLASHLGFFSA
mmetsp:Transcript_118291/g.381829  ORF Transcript_118291/g.381829 Transcript_118291/m.381829 type:complete len:235 (-) Transcript_118291:1002-1706(-)